MQLYVEFRDLQRWVSYRRYDKTCHIHSYFYTGIIFSLLFACTYHEIIRKGMNRKLFNNRHFVFTHTHSRKTHTCPWRLNDEGGFVDLCKLYVWTLLYNEIEWKIIHLIPKWKGVFSEIAGNEYKLHPLNLHN